MIRLTKTDKPKVLVDHEDEWRIEYMQEVAAGLARGKRKKRYNHPSIKSELIYETVGKCAYCESKIMHVSWGEIEHIVPVSQNPALVVAWDNLTLACPVCNGTKSDYWEEGNEILNPYVDQPDEHVIFAGPVVLARPGSQRGATTIDQIGLNRPGLIERRQERLDRINHLLNAFEAMTPGPSRDAVAGVLKAEAEKSMEFSATVTAHLNRDPAAPV